MDLSNILKIPPYSLKNDKEKLGFLNSFLNQLSKFQIIS